MRETPPDGHFSPRVREAISKLEQAAPAAILARHGGDDHIDYDRLEHELTVDPYIEDVLARVKEIASRDASRDASQMKNAPLCPLLEQVERWARAAGGVADPGTAPATLRDAQCDFFHGGSKMNEW